MEKGLILSEHNSLLIPPHFLEVGDALDQNIEDHENNFGYSYPQLSAKLSFVLFGRKFIMECLYLLESTFESDFL